MYNIGYGILCHGAYAITEGGQSVATLVQSNDTALKRNSTMIIMLHRLRHCMLYGTIGRGSRLIKGRGHRGSHEGRKVYARYQYLGAKSNYRSCMLVSRSAKSASALRNFSRSPCEE